MANDMVWGFEVQTSASGRKIWPNDLKREAARRIREDGQSAGEVAADLGAHECLVRKWSVADRRSRGEKIQVERPAFTEIKTALAPAPTVSPSPHEPKCNNGTARLIMGNFSFEFPISASEGDLLKLVRVARECS